MNKPEQIDDIEVIAQTVRYARAAQPGTRARDILTMLSADFPEVDEGRIKAAMRSAAQRLEAQHHGW